MARVANLRVLDVDELKSVPHVPVSHPFIERLIGVDADWKLTSFCSLCRPFGDHPRFSTDTGQCETGAGGQSGIGENKYVRNASNIGSGEIC